MDEFSEVDDDDAVQELAVGSQQRPSLERLLRSDSLSDFEHWLSLRHPRHVPEAESNNAEEGEANDDDVEGEDEGEYSDQNNCYNFFSSANEDDDDENGDADDDDDEDDDDDDDDDDDADKDGAAYEEEADILDPPREFVFTSNEVPAVAAILEATSSRSALEETGDLDQQMARILIQCLQQHGNNSSLSSEQRRNEIMSTVDDSERNRHADDTHGEIVDAVESLQDFLENVDDDAVR